jgi:hypothetical protein
MGVGIAGFLKLMREKGALMETSDDYQGRYKDKKPF